MLSVVYIFFSRRWMKCHPPVHIYIFELIMKLINQSIRSHYCGISMTTPEYFLDTNWCTLTFHLNTCLVMQVNLYSFFETRHELCQYFQYTCPNDSNTLIPVPSILHLVYNSPLTCIQIERNGKYTVSMARCQFLCYMTSHQTIRYTWSYNI